MGNVKGRLLKVDYVNTDKVREEHSQVQQYTNSYNLGDFTSDDDIPNLRAVRALVGTLSSGYTIQATTTDSNPLIVNSATLLANNITSLYPNVSRTIPLYGTTDSDTTEGVVTRVDYIFTDNTKTVLQEIRLWGNDNGGLFNEDTLFSVSN